MGYHRPLDNKLSTSIKFEYLPQVDHHKVRHTNVGCHCLRTCGRSPLQSLQYLLFCFQHRHSSQMSHTYVSDSERTVFQYFSIHTGEDFMRWKTTVQKSFKEQPSCFVSICFCLTIYQLYNGKFFACVIPLHLLRMYFRQCYHDIVKALSRYCL